MKMTYNDIAGKHAILMRLGAKILPRKASEAIARNIVALEKEMQISTKQRIDIANRYAKKEDGEFVLDASNTKYTFENPDDEKAFIEESKELSNIAVEVGLVKFGASELSKCYESERYDILTPVQQAEINWMIDYN